jgi:hypothetical protein
MIQQDDESLSLTVLVLGLRTCCGLGPWPGPREYAGCCMSICSDYFFGCSLQPYPESVDDLLPTSDAMLKRYIWGRCSHGIMPWARHSCTLNRTSRGKKHRQRWVHSAFTTGVRFELPLQCITHEMLGAKPLRSSDVTKECDLYMVNMIQSRGVNTNFLHSPESRKHFIK